MKRVGLIVTGECERRALGRSLQRFFRQMGADVEVTVDRHVDSFTSAAIPEPENPLPPSHAHVLTTADKFARALLAAVESRGYDVVVGVDDLELANAGRAERVTRHLREALTRSLPQPPTAALLQRLRTEASFHLLAPMLEASFFPEQAALDRAGRVPGRSSRFRWPIVDFEAFEVNDPDFAAPPDETNPDLRGRTWAIPDRSRHPKAYVRFLAQPDDPACRERRYRESREGVRALETLDWNVVLGHPTHGSLLRSMLRDVAEGLDLSPVFEGDLHPATAPRSGGVLRNL